MYYYPYTRFALIYERENGYLKNFSVYFQRVRGEWYIQREMTRGMDWLLKKNKVILLNTWFPFQKESNQMSFYVVKGKDWEGGGRTRITYPLVEDLRGKRYHCVYYRRGEKMIFRPLRLSFEPLPTQLISRDITPNCPGCCPEPIKRIWRCPESCLCRGRGFVGRCPCCTLEGHVCPICLHLEKNITRHFQTYHQGLQSWPLERDLDSLRPERAIPGLLLEHLLETYTSGKVSCWEVSKKKFRPGELPSQDASPPVVLEIPSPPGHGIHIGESSPEEPAFGRSPLSPSSWVGRLPETAEKEAFAPLGGSV